MSEPPPGAEVLSLREALAIAVRELRRRRASIRRRFLSRDRERWAPQLGELAVAIAVLEAFARNLPDS